MVKKLSAFVLAAVMTVSLAACGSSESGNQTQKTESQTQAETENTAAESDSAETTDSETPAQDDTAENGEGSGIVVYFSWSGNTRTIAEEIKSQTGADIFELTPATPYSTDYDTVLDEAKAEQSEDARPEIANTIENFDQYDVVYLGYPNWWGDMPMIIYSFLDDYDLSGKTIVPFVSSGGSGFSNSLTTIAEMEPDAVVTEGLSLSSSESENPGDQVSEWLSSLAIE